MHCPKPKRGRPPGGLWEDGQRLYEIALRIGSDPPTPGDKRASRLSIRRAISKIERLAERQDYVHERRLRAKYEAKFEPIHGDAGRLYIQAEREYDPVRHSDVKAGTLARIKPNSAFFPDIGRNGWHLVRHTPYRDGSVLPRHEWKDGEWIIRRATAWRLLTLQELHEQCAGGFAQIDFAQIRVNATSDRPQDGG